MTRLGFNLRRSRPKQLGQTMILITGGIVALIAAAGLAVDIGSMRNVRERMQTAADSAAIAGAAGINNDTWQTAAQNDAAKNGFSNNKSGIDVEVHHPPLTGSYSGNNDYVQVAIAQPEPTYFMRILGMTTMNVSVNSVAHMGSSPDCIFDLDPHASGAFGTMSASGGAAFVANCGIVIDSDSSTAATASGSGTVVKGSHIGIVGGYSINSGAVFLPTPQTGIIPVDDPLLYVPQPSTPSPSSSTCYGSKDQATSVAGGATLTLTGGAVFCKGLTVNGGGTLNISDGIYTILGGGLKINGGATVNGTNIMVFDTKGSDNPHSFGEIYISGQAVVNLKAPTSGTYSGILFFQDRSVTAGQMGADLEGGAAQSLEGALYFPTTALKYAGGSSTSAKYTIVVADTITVTGAANFGDDYSGLADGSPIKAAVLAE